MINIERISKTYPGVSALKDVNLSVKEGELFGLIGPDGAGKTSLIRILATVLLPDSGSATLLGHDVVKDYKLLRQKIGYMPGRFSLYQDLSIAENLEFFANVFGTSIEKNYDLIRDIYVQIEPFKHRRAGALSGGMKQKLALCCALIHKPEILLLDEPGTGVDPVSRKEFWDMLKRLREWGITIFVSTPNMDEAELCDRIALIQKGKILATDTPDGIRSLYTKPLFAVRSQEMFKLIRDLRNYLPTDGAFAFGEYVHLSLRSEHPFTPMQNAEKITEITQYLASKHHQNIEIHPVAAGIEDYFIDQINQNPA